MLIFFMDTKSRVFRQYYGISTWHVPYPIFHGLFKELVMIYEPIVELLIGQFATKTDQLNGIAHSSWKFNIFSLTHKKIRKISVYLTLMAAKSA